MRKELPGQALALLGEETLLRQPNPRALIETARKLVQVIKRQVDVMKAQEERLARQEARIKELKSLLRKHKIPIPPQGQRLKETNK